MSEPIKIADLDGENISVDNVRTYKKIPGEFSFYVAREMKNHKASPLGNPFRLQDHGKAAFQMYRVWLQQQIKLQERVYNELIQIANLHLKGEKIVLLCWCYPNMCHANIIKNAVIYLAGKIKAGEIIVPAQTDNRPRPKPCYIINTKRK